MGYEIRNRLLGLVNKTLKISFFWKKTFIFTTTLYTSRKPPRHLLAPGVPSCEEPGSAHEQTCKISREELPHPIKQRRDELRKIYFFVSLPLRCRLLISVDSCAKWGWPDTLGTIQGATKVEFWINDAQKNGPHWRKTEVNWYPETLFYKLSRFRW